jgi:hypothetical protein
MNKLFRVLTIGGHIPYAVLLSYYLTRLYLVYFCILSIYLASSYAVLTNKQYLNKGVLAWVRAKRVCELLLISSFSLRSYFKSQLFTILYVGLFTGLLIKTPRRYQGKCEHSALYVTVCMFFLTNADIMGKTCTILLSLLIMYEPQAKNVTTSSFEFAIERRIKQYHTVKLLQIYMLFFMEYSVTTINMYALLIIIVSVSLFNAYAVMTLEQEAEVKVNEFYLKVNELPCNYPLPLDVREAINSCKVAEKVFKSYQI